LKQFQEAVGKTLEQIGTTDREQLPKQNSKGSTSKRYNNKWECIKLKSFSILKKTVSILKRQPIENLFQLLIQ
jgi:hypothetical protein